MLLRGSQQFSYISNQISQNTNFKRVMSDLSLHGEKCRKSKKIQVYLLCVVVVRDTWTVDIGLDSSVVEHLTSDAGVQGLIPDHAIYFHLCFSVYICLNTVKL